MPFYINSFYVPFTHRSTMWVRLQSKKLRHYKRILTFGYTSIKLLNMLSYEYIWKISSIRVLKVLKC